MRRATRHHLRFDSLEDKTLLSNIHPLAVQKRAIPAAVVRPAQTSTTPTVTSSDVQALQQHESSDNLVVFLANLALVTSTRANVQQFATQILNTHETGDEAIDKTAMSLNILLPSDISQASDQQSAQTVLKALNTPNFDQTFLSTILQVEQARVTTAQNLVNNTSINSAIRNVVQPEIAQDTQVVTQAQALLNNLGPTGSQIQGNGPSSPSNDAEYVQVAHSTNVFEILISQAAALLSSRSDVQTYAQKLISDHHMSDLQVSELASYRGQTLSPVLSPMDLANARQVLATANTANFDPLYLSTNVSAHQNDIQTNQQELARTQDPNVRQYAKDDIPTDNLHLIGAQFLQNNGNVLSGFTSFQDAGVTNVRIRFRHPGNGTLRYDVTFDSGAFRFTQSYSLKVHRIGGNHGTASLNSVDAVTLFLQSLYSRIHQGSSGGTSSGSGSSSSAG
jgi:putative membrane protein